VEERLKELEGSQGEQQAEGVADEQGAAQAEPVEQTTAAEPNQTQKATEAPKKADGEDDENSQTYKQRWAALQGTLNAERQKVETLTNQVNLLMQQVHQLRDAGNTLSANATQGEIADHLSSLATEFGDDFAKALQSVVRGEIASIIDQRIKPVEEQVGQVAHDTEQARRDRFNAELESMAPGWRATWASSEFQHWLDTTTERFSGKTFRDLFGDANRDWDTPRIAGFFTTFNEATGKATSNKDDAAQSDDPRRKLVTPGRSSASQPSPTNQPKIWTMAEVNAFYRSCQRGDYQGREAEAVKIEAEIDRANAEGRIR
jgi:hypothetical protein